MFILLFYYKVDKAGTDSCVRRILPGLSGSSSYSGFVTGIFYGSWTKNTFDIVHGLQEKVLPGLSPPHAGSLLSDGSTETKRKRDRDPATAIP